MQHQLFKWITKLDKKAYLGCQLLSYFVWQCLQEFSLFLFARILCSFDPVSVILVALSLSDVCLVNYAFWLPCQYAGKGGEMRSRPWSLQPDNVITYSHSRPLLSLA